MQNYKFIKMTATQFAQWVWDNKDLLINNEIVFALNDNSTEESYDYSNWWFFTRLTFPAFVSDSIYIDYCGGGEAHVFNLDDEEAFKESIKYFFKYLEDIGEYNEDDQIILDLGEEE